MFISAYYEEFAKESDRLCGLVVRVPGSEPLGSIPGATGFSE
jgi:hypothetical protein